MGVGNKYSTDEDGDLTSDDRSNSQDDFPLVTLTTPELTHNWADITQEFAENVKSLALGELLHDENFGLFEAMSAIEMMDPKMDAGMLCNRGDKPVLSFDEAVKQGTLQLEGLSYSDQIGIIDQTLACLVSWLEGHSLAQTVFTNLYLHKPHLVEDRPLKAFCILTYKLVDIIKWFIHQASVFEEEDYQPMQYGYKLKPEVSDARCIGMLREVEEELQRKTRQKPPPFEMDKIVALQARIRFARLSFTGLISLNKQEGKTEGRPDVRPDGEIQKALNSCAEPLKQMQETINLGTQAEHSGINMIGFDPLVNQRLLPPTFPRYTKIKSREDAIAYYMELVQRLKVVCKIYNHTTFHSALDFFIEFSRHNPCILSRSVLQVLYTPQNHVQFGTAILVDTLRDAAKSFICPPSLVSRSVFSANPQAKEFVDTFLLRCGRPFIHLIQLCGHNRARQRDKLAQLLEDFSALQEEAERVDAYLHTLQMKCDSQRSHLACFGTWILYLTLRIMVMYLLSGFELELYSVHEYHYIFWYLYEFLYGWLVSSLTRADTFLMDQESALEREAASRGKGKKVKKGKKKGARPYFRLITLCQALQHMCGGYYKAMVAFHQTGKINQPKSEFDCERVRYEHRFQPFSNLLTPPPMRYNDFQEITSQLIASLNSQSPDEPPDFNRLYTIASKNFQQGRALLETILNPDQEMNELVKICKTNFVVLKLLAGGHKNESKTPPAFDFSLHRHFPVIKLV